LIGEELKVAKKLLRFLDEIYEKGELKMEQVNICQEKKGRDQKERSCKYEMNASIQWSLI